MGVIESMPVKWVPAGVRFVTKGGRMFTALDSHELRTPQQVLADVAGMRVVCDYGGTPLLVPRNMQVTAVFQEMEQSPVYHASWECDVN